jgi:methylglutaconyl-CoA hydratase
MPVVPLPETDSLMTAATTYWTYDSVVLRLEAETALLELNEPEKRNALGVRMFSSLHAALSQCRVLAEAEQGPIRSLLLSGRGPAFCGGFDLAACHESPALLRTLVEQLSAAIQALRALPVPVVAQVHGVALAGGCALLAGCDLVLVAPDAQLGYPVHRIGVSPAVTLPALMANAGPGRTREITMSGTLYTGVQAVRAGLATSVTSTAQELAQAALTCCAALNAKGPRALRATKAWLNELDGSQCDANFAHTAAASAAAAEGDEFAALLRAFWSARK